MPVYNGAPFVEAGIRSLLAQTDPDFEVIVVDDGSTDGTAEVVERIGDRRIVFLSQENRGVAFARNKALSVARGGYIAFQDHDDLSSSARLEIQRLYLSAHPATGLVGSWSEILSGNGSITRGHTHPLTDSELRLELMFDNPFVTSSVMMRRKVLDEVGVFTTQAERHPEDLEYWARVSRKFKVENLPNRLVTYRQVTGSLSGTHKPRLIANLVAENMAAVFGLAVPTKAMRDLAYWHHGAFEEISDEPDFEAMFSIAMDAADRLATDRKERSNLRYRAARHIGRLKVSGLGHHMSSNLRFKRRFLKFATRLAKLV